MKIPERAQKVVAQARADLAARENVSADEVEVVRVEAVDWPDASLGCPEPGMMYAQVITPGWRIVLRVGSREAIYHTDQRRVIPASPR
jgi:hypothetical protein